MHRMTVVFILLLAVTLTSACAPGSGRVVRVEVPPAWILDPVRVYTNLMFELGYRRLGVLNPRTGQPNPVVVIYDDYRMLFALSDDTDLRVSMQISVDGENCKLIMYREGDKGLGEQDKLHYQALIDKLQQEFGPDRVDGD